jgi:hypothetical protein
LEMLKYLKALLLQPLKWVMISSFFAASLLSNENAKSVNKADIGYIKVVLLNKYWAKSIELTLPIGTSVQHEDFIFYPRAYKNINVGDGYKLHQAFLEIWRIHENYEGTTQTRSELFFSNVLTSEKPALYDDEYEILLIEGK